MKLKDDFFKIENISINDDKVEYAIRLNQEHFIYKAHFPENPITPGVCIIQIIKELTEENLQCELFFRKAAKIKFLNVINPIENETVNIILSITEGKADIKIEATVFYSNITFSRLSFVAERIEDI